MARTLDYLVGSILGPLYMDRLVFPDTVSYKAPDLTFPIFAQSNEFVVP